MECMADMEAPPPRVFCIPAQRCSVVAVLRRGPSAWANIGRWDTQARTYERGARLRGTIYHQRSDLSPDGRFLCYMAMSNPQRIGVDAIYIAISLLPSLDALAAWSIGSTWPRGLHFEEPGDFNEAADAGDRTQVPFGLSWTAPVPYSVERRRGWIEAENSPPAAADDPWQTRRAQELIMQKQRPGDDNCTLRVTGAYAAFREGSPDRSPARYTIQRSGHERTLGGVQWADWDGEGRLLIATTGGELQIREPRGDDFEVVWSHDLRT